MAMVDLTTVKDEGPEVADLTGACLPTVYLSSEQCEALGLSTAITAGQVVTFKAIAKVVRATTSTDDADAGEADGDIDVSLSLQITDMEVNVGAGSDAAKALYGKD